MTNCKRNDIKKLTFMLEQEIIKMNSYKESVE